MTIQKDTATSIALAYREIEAAEKLLADVRGSISREDDIRDAFGHRHDCLQLGVPSGENRRRLFDVPFTLAIPIIEAHIEIADHIGTKSKSRISEILIALEERGHIRRLANRPRAIELIDERSSVSLPPHIDAQLRNYCAKHGERPADIIADAVDLFLDQIEGSAIDAVTTV